MTHHHLLGRTVAVAAFAVGSLAGPAATRGAVEPELAFSLGYVHLSLDDTTVGEMAEEGGFRMEPRFTVAPWDERPQLRIGVGLGLSFFYDETDGRATIVDADGDVFIGDADDYEQLFMFTPEFQLSWRQRWDNGWALEGGVGVGGAIAHYTAGEQFFNEFYDQQLSETDATFTARPFVRGGYRSEGFTLGLESSYLWGFGGSLDFADGIGGELEEWYLGVFFAWTR